ncbi:cache domain-containing protein [Geobacter pelophilus]|uniref:histidine kinase n=1 Tax=Geoanaerobacter pelophilus TaxID=60036 RepID=A0AAW4L357_9BACT|nr:cache domain-containing protein [Geoanaerobacter pelophilus]MBT0665373.1 cache domain-containing protein [Geoanaerobacter pelophilus]
MKSLRYSIRLKLTVATMVPLVVAITLCWIIGATLITTRIFAQAQNKVKTDLNAAHELFLAEQARTGDIIRLTGLSPELSDSVEKATSNSIAVQLHGILRNERLAFLTVVDRYGMVVYRAANPGISGDSLATVQSVEKALSGAAYSGVAVIAADVAGKENPGLPELMKVQVKDTPHARTYAKKLEDRGMFIVAASPLKTAAGRTVGAVYGGKLLNGDNSLVERISRVVFDRGEGGSGNATIFMDDVRIATTVIDQSGTRVIGTRMSEEVYGEIIRGENWTGRAFVYNAWHLSAYEPIRDINNSIVGALYAGTPEQPLLEVRWRIHAIFTGVIMFVALLGFSTSAWISSRLSRPIKALEEGARRIASGESLPDIHVDTQDEIASLANEFNVMKKRLQVREEEILTLNRTLEQKVVERTAQLEAQGARLLEAQAELARSERLAGLGMLSAGVAHEINNPLAIIRGNAELLQFSNPVGSENSDEVVTIMRQVARIERIIRNLLVFSRGTEKRIAQLSLGGLLDEILDTVHHQLQLDNYQVMREYRNVVVHLEGDEDQLRQVFTNLIVNGLQAMAQGGILTIGFSQDTEGSVCRVTISDTGPGITQEQMEKLFTPFFSTKRGGTGLGLAVSYGIVRDHGGDIYAESTAGEGATFTVVLPLKQGGCEGQSVGGDG